MNLMNCMSQILRRVKKKGHSMKNSLSMLSEEDYNEVIAILEELKISVKDDKDEKKEKKGVFSKIKNKEKKDKKNKKGGETPNDE